MELAVPMLGLAISSALFAQAPVVTAVTNFISRGAGLSPGTLAAVSGAYLTGDVVSVEVGGKLAGLVKPQSAETIQVPFELAPGPTTLVVTTKAGASIPFSITLQAYAPAVKNDLPCSNTGAPDDVSTAVATGLGATDPFVPTGVIPALRVPTAVKPSVTVGGEPAEVLESVLANWYLAVYEVKFRTPRGLAEGSQPVVLTISDKSSNPTYMTVTKHLLQSSSNGTGAPEAMESARRCGGALATTNATADPRNPPNTLGGTTVTVRDSAGVERTARIQSVSPNQVDYIIPSETALGDATLTITAGDGRLSSGALTIQRVAPYVFCGEEFECGFPVATVVRLRNGIKTVEPVGEILGPPRPGACCGDYRHIPIDMGPETDKVFLVLYGTGLRFRSSLGNVSLWINLYGAGIMTLPVEYAGPQNEFPGLDQVNVELPRSLAGRGLVALDVLVDGNSSTYTWLTFQ